MTFDLLIEGLVAIFYLTSLVLWIPGIATVLAARTQFGPAATGYIAAAILVGWLRFSGNLVTPSSKVIAVLYLISLAGLLVPLVRRIDIVSALAAAFSGAATALVWWPALDANANALFDTLPGRNAAGLLQFTVYTLAVLTPVILGAIVLGLIPSTATVPFRPVMVFAGGGLICLLMVINLAGFMDNLTDWLAEMTASGELRIRLRFD